MIRIDKKGNTFSDNQTVKLIANKLRNAGCISTEDETQLLYSEAQSLEELIKNVAGLPLE